jgi:FtsP/CotA-like multicopper oxidase with cupredoxin domain
MVRIGQMARPVFPIDRRALLAGLGATTLVPALPITPAMAQQDRLLRAKPDVLSLRTGGPDTPVWSLGGAELRFKRGDKQPITFENDLPVPMALNWRGLDGAAATEPLTARHPVAAGAKDVFEIPLRHAGTYLCELSLLSDGQARPARGLPLIISETEADDVDRDEVLLIEQWQLRPDGTAVTPGTDPKDSKPVYSINGQASREIKIRPNERLRFRIINACQRIVIAIKFEDSDVRANHVWVMALDGQPAEPFLARNSALVLAPGGRVDAFIDATGPAGTISSILLHDGKQARPIGRMVISSEPPIRTTPLPPAPPLPSNGLPAQLDLKNALRFDLPLGGAPGDWTTPSGFSAASRPAFRAKAGRVVVLALTNRGSVANVFHLHGHHFRLLDRLDDGWKPFWLDTLAVEPGTTQRIAFAAEHAGPWLIESVATDWAAPRLVRWYSVP